VQGVQQQHILTERTADANTITIPMAQAILQAAETELRLETVPPPCYAAEHATTACSKEIYNTSRFSSSSPLQRT
jgi:hypothetical protein